MATKNGRRYELPPHLVRAYQADKIDMYDIVRIVGKAPSTVFQALKRRGVDTTKSRRRMRGRNQRMIDLVQNGASLAEVGRKFEVERERVRQLVNQRIIALVLAEGLSCEEAAQRFGYDAERVYQIVEKYLRSPN